jgi:SAM-dependent methyltransferase
VTESSFFTELAAWLETPPGRYMLEWEQQQLDHAVADLFGFHALQLGWPQLDALRANRMPHRWRSGEGEGLDAPSTPGGAPLNKGIALHCDFDALPFPSQSLDLVVLPHALELASDPHQTLREVERVLVPEGRAVILGFNPASLWGLSQRMGRMRQRLGGRVPLFLPRTGEFIGYWRLRDWLRLLSFEVERGRFGCYRPGVRTQRWLDRFQWIEPTGERWWPVFGAVYFVVAVKRVRGMRLVGLRRKDALKAKPAPAVVANSHRGSMK